MKMKNKLDSLERIVLVMDKTIDFGIAIAGLGLIAYGLYDKNLLTATLGGILANLGAAMHVREDDIPPTDYSTVDFRGRYSYLMNMQIERLAMTNNYHNGLFLLSDALA